MLTPRLNVSLKWGQTPFAGLVWGLTGGGGGGEIQTWLGEHEL
jgi:hypothetical protein